jgi:hypothetical protein
VLNPYLPNIFSILFCFVFNNLTIWSGFQWKHLITVILSIWKQETFQTWVFNNCQFYKTHNSYIESNIIIKCSFIITFSLYNQLYYISIRFLSLNSIILNYHCIVQSNAILLGIVWGSHTLLGKYWKDWELFYLLIMHFQSLKIQYTKL